MVPLASESRDGAKSTASGDRQGELTTIRPSALAHLIEELAGRTVRVERARVVGVINPRAFLVESATSIPAAMGVRDRILVFVGSGVLRVPREVLVGSTIVVTGVARTLLGMQMTAEVPWPAELRRDSVGRLEIRAAILASAVQTADGVDLTTRAGGS